MGRHQPRWRLKLCFFLCVLIQSVSVRIFQRYWIPPPNADIHALIREEIAAIILEFLDEIFRISQYQRMVGIQLVNELVKGGDIRQPRPTTRYPLFGSPAEQSGMMTERFDPVPHLLPFSFLDGFARQF